MWDTIGMYEFIVWSIQNLAVSENWKSTEAAVRIRRPSESDFCWPTSAESTRRIPLIT
jgi:hypothetical protein